MADAYIVMTGNKAHSVFTDDANNGDGIGAAQRMSGELGASSVDDPPDIARGNGIWVQRVQLNPPA